MKNITSIYKKIAFYVLSVSVLFTYSCAPAYIPSSVNVPLHHEGGEFSASLLTGTSGGDAQFSVSVTDHLGIMANGSYADRTSDSSDSYHRHISGEFGIGYYDNFARNFVFEIYGGYGMGLLESKFDGDDFIVSDILHEAIQSKYFLQPALGVSNQVVDAAFSTRFTLLNIDVNDQKFQDLFIEPAITCRIGYRNVRFITQFGLSFPSDYDLAYSYRPLIFNVGINVNLGRDY
ncbi:MAG: hypothetical protein MI922_19745 [Bacteroidales bacterium]|nr:hypothetical protein [Bacteroidales bacterium]